MKRWMKVLLSALIGLLLLLGAAACGGKETAPGAGNEGGQAAAGTEKEDVSVQIANPWRDLTEDEARALFPQSFVLPEGAENAAWSMMEAPGEAPLWQLEFDLDGNRFTARQQQTGDRNADISGMYYSWTAQTAVTLGGGQTGSLYRYRGEEETSDLCLVYDEAAGLSYSLSVTARDLDGFDLQAVAEALLPAAQSSLERQDGERFEAVIVLEGMEETVLYEHIRNEALGFRMDYEYESLVRQSEADRERLISLWDDAGKPENYLEITRSTQDAETAAAAIAGELSQAYELQRDDAFPLERAGACIRIDASVGKGGEVMPRLQTVYILPTADGCRIAAAHYSLEAAEGFGRRFQCMMDTFSPIVGE